MATILLLALTVTLFSAIFAFVTAFPAPPAQTNNQFQASLVFTSNLSYVAGIRIVHLAGPAVPGNAQIYLKSANQPTAPEFQSPYLVSSGLTGSTTWNLGQVWSLTFPSTEMPSARGNITVFIVSQSQLLFSIILPGTALVSPPTIVSTSVSPAVPLVGKSFTVYATLAGTYRTNSVFVNLAAVPGGPSSPQIMTQNAQGQWTFTLSSGATTNGTFYGFVNASGPTGSGLTAVAAVVITVSTGGGTTNGPFSVGVILIPSPPSGNTSESVQAVVTYTGVLSPAATLNVTFTAISNPYTAANKWVSWAPSGATISGGTSVTVVAKSAWLIPSTSTHPSVTAGTAFTVYANATINSVTIPGTLTFTPAYLNTGSTITIRIGGSVEVNGSYFQPNTPVALSVGGVAQTISSSPACSPGTPSSTYSNVTTSSSGTFSCWFKLASGTPLTGFNVLATDLTSGQTATSPLVVTDWLITVSPLTLSHTVSQTIYVNGTGWASSSLVSVALNGTAIGSGTLPAWTCVTTGTYAGSSVSGGTITTTSSGKFSCSFTMQKASGAAVYSFVAYDYTSGQQSATIYFSRT